MDGSKRNQLEQVLLERIKARHALPARLIANRIDSPLRRTIPEFGIRDTLSMFFLHFFSIFFFYNLPFYTKLVHLRTSCILSFSRFFHATSSKYRKIFSLLWVINYLKTTTSYHDRARSFHTYVYMYMCICRFFSFSLIPQLIICRVYRVIITSRVVYLVFFIID